MPFNYPSLSAYSSYWLWRAIQFFNQVNRFGSLADLTPDGTRRLSHLLSVFAKLYLASSIILPVVLAFVLKLLLQPAVRLLQRVHLPRAVGALLAVLLAIGMLVGVVAGLSVPAANWATKPPEGIPRLEDLGLSGSLFSGTRAVLGGLFTTVLVLHFLLVAGDIPSSHR